MNFKTIARCIIASCFFMFGSVFVTQLYAQGSPFVSVQSGVWNDGATWGNTSPGVAGTDYPSTSGDVTISSNDTVSYTGTISVGVNSGAAMNLTVAADAVLDVTGDVVEISSSRSVITNNGSMQIAGNLTQQQGAGSGASDRSYIHNNGTIQITGGNYSNNQNATFENASGALLKITNGNFTTNASAYFENSGSVVVDNVVYASVTVSFNNINYKSDIALNSGSEFRVYNSDLNITGTDTLALNGIITINDGDLSETINITIGVDGGIYLRDTDAFGDDGVLIMNSGGQTITNNGNIFAETISTKGGAITVTDNNIVFIHKLADLNFDAGSNELNVSATGKLYYCDNPDRASLSNLGTVTTGGMIYYSNLAYAVGDTPDDDNVSSGTRHQDFNVESPSTDQYIIEDELGYSSCSAAFYGVLQTTLPIQLVSFVAYAHNNTSVIQWKTLSETDNDFFTILRSYDGVRFEEIAIVAGAGNSSHERSYEYVDNSGFLGTVYYQLQQTDFDGTSTVSNIVVVSHAQQENAVFWFTKHAIQVTFKDMNIPTHIVIATMDGKVFYSQTYNNVNSTEINIPLSPGMYVVTAIQNGVMHTHKFNR